jgi:hypothetical protein
VRIARFAKDGDVAYGVVGEAQGDGASAGAATAATGSGLAIAELRGHPFAPGESVQFTVVAGLRLPRPPVEPAAPR